MTELTEGVNTYSVIPIIMRDRNADSILEEFRQKIKCGEMLTRHELAVSYTHLTLPTKLEV